MTAVMSLLPEVEQGQRIQLARLTYSMVGVRVAPGFEDFGGEVLNPLFAFAAKNGEQRPDSDNPA
jgi:hypothetical protein